MTKKRSMINKLTQEGFNIKLGNNLINSFGIAWIN